MTEGQFLRDRSFLLVQGRGTRPTLLGVRLRVVFGIGSAQNDSLFTVSHFVIPVGSFYINIIELTTQPGPFGATVLAPAQTPEGRPFQGLTLDLVESRLLGRIPRSSVQLVLGPIKVDPSRTD